MAVAWVQGPPPPPPKPPPAEVLTALGLYWEGEEVDEEEPEFIVDVWPENSLAVSVFLAMGSQWRISAGMGGMVWHGLDYNALPIVEARMGVQEADREDLFARLRILQDAARPELNKSN